MTQAGVTIAIAGVVTEVLLPDHDWAALVLERYAAFLSHSAPAWRVTVYRDPAQPSLEPGWVEHAGAVTGFHVYRYRGEIDLSAHSAWVTAPEPARVASALERTLTYVLMQTLPREHDALLVHACGVAIGGRGYVFFGPSGAGKTTIARLAGGYAEVFGDENVVLRLAADGVELHSTPFWGSSTPAGLIHRADRAVPLAMLLRLVHCSEFALVPVTAGQGVAALLETEKVATERVESASAWLAVAGQIVERVPVHTLGFAPRKELWPFLLRHEGASAV